MSTKCHSGVFIMLVVTRVKDEEEEERRSSRLAANATNVQSGALLFIEPRLRFFFVFFLFSNIQWPTKANLCTFISYHLLSVVF